MPIIPRPGFTLVKHIKEEYSPAGIVLPEDKFRPLSGNRGRVIAVGDDTMRQEYDKKGRTVGEPKFVAKPDAKPGDLVVFTWHKHVLDDDKYLVPNDDIIAVIEQ